MGLFSRRTGGKSHPVTQIEEDITQMATQTPGELIHFVPDKDNGGMGTMATVWGRLHAPEISKLRGNVTDPLAFEVYYDGKTVGLYAQTSVDRAETLQTRLKGTYPESRIDPVDAGDPGFPSIEAGEYVAGATFSTKQHSHYPLCGWGDLDDDPYTDIIEEMTTGDSRVVFQIVARDEPDSWTRGTDGGLLGSGTPGIPEKVKQLEAGESVGWRNPDTRDPTEEEKTKASIIEDELGKRGFNTTIRVLVIGDDEDEVQRRCSELSDLLEGAYEARKTEQELVASPVSERRLRAFIDACHARAWEDNRTILTVGELAALGHPPEGDALSNPAMLWALGDLGPGIPPTHPLFEWESVELPEAATRVEKQAVMLDESGRADPYWIGWGAKHGVEAGIYEEYTDKHMQITGRTGTGKTTFATNLGSQIMDRGYGALIVVLGKDDDDEAFIAEWPEDRPRKDFVFIDTGDDFDHKVRFNLLEVPEELEPGTTTHRSYIENLCDDFCAAFAQAGGEDSLYPLMRGVTRTLVRGMAMSERTCTPLDLAEAASRHTNMAEFAAWMESEGIPFIDETARRFAEDKEEGDFEPIARRMEEIRHNGNIREWLAAREPTVRIQNLVDEGKICVLRIDETLGDSERAFAINPIVRRFGFSKKMASKFGTNDDPFYFIWDEADKAITTHSSVAQMLSEYRGYGARFCLMYQSPSYQLPTYLKQATEAQIATTVSFASKSTDAGFVAKQHSEGIDTNSVTSIPEYTCYLNTGAKGRDETPSVRVDAFPPIGEVRDELGETGGMTDEEITEMKREAARRHGEIPPSTEVMKSQSHFSSGTIDGEEEGKPDELDMSVEYCRNQALKAIYDASIRQGTPGGFVAVETLLDRLQDYLPGGESLTDTGKAWRSVFQKLPDAFLSHRKPDDGNREVRADDTSFLNVGESENDGADEHWEQMADAYIPMTQLGFVYEIPAQTGEAMPDAIARLDDVLELDDVDDPGAIAERVNGYRDQHRLLDRLAGTKALYIESEHSTGATQPSQTIQNLVQAANDGHRCLFIAREAVAERVHNTLEREPFCCRTSHPEPGERRFYTGTSSLVIDGETMTRPGAAENVWIHDEAADEYVLRDTNGTVHARFSTPAEIFEAAGKYPAGGERTIKPPVIPKHEFDDIDDVEYDIVVVPEPERNEAGEKEPLTPFDLELYRDESENVPLPYLVDDIELDISAPHGNGEPAAVATIDDAAEEFDNSHRK